MDRFLNFLKWLGITGAVALIISLFFYILCLNHVTVNQVGIAYNSIDGTVTKQEHPGWYRTSVFVSVGYVSTLPITVTIPSEAKVINAKVVRFKVSGLDEYIKLQGFSTSMGSKLENILLGYAYSGQDYPFLEVIQSGTSVSADSLNVKK